MGTLVDVIDWKCLNYTTNNAQVDFSVQGGYTLYPVIMGDGSLSIDHYGTDGMAALLNVSIPMYPVARGGESCVRYVWYGKITQAGNQLWTGKRNGCVIFGFTHPDAIASAGNFLGSLYFRLVRDFYSGGFYYDVTTTNMLRALTNNLITTPYYTGLYYRSMPIIGISDGYHLWQIDMYFSSSPEFGTLRVEVNIDGNAISGQVPLIKSVDLRHVYADTFLPVYGEWPGTSGRAPSAVFIVGGCADYPMGSLGQNYVSVVTRSLEVRI